jgi:hypothetical protein
MLNALVQFAHRVAAIFRRATLDRERAKEMSAHLDLAIEENLEAGLSAEDARRLALARFGGTRRALENHRNSRSLPKIETLAQDLRFTFRALGSGVVFSFAPDFGASGHAAEARRLAGGLVQTRWESPDHSRGKRTFACVLGFLASQAMTPEVGASAPTFIIIKQDWAFAPEELSFSSHHATQEVLP